MKSKYDNFDLKDRSLMELNFLIGAFGVLHSTDPEKLSQDDMEKFCNGLAWHTEFLRNELEDYFYPEK